MATFSTVQLFRSLVSTILASVTAAKHAAVEPAFLSRARRRISDENAFYAAEVLVSVIIPTFDRHEILHTRTVPSILNQTHTAVEIIVVGDGCSKEIAQQHATKLSRDGVRFYNLRWRTRYPREALSRWMVMGTRPMNVGLRKATGEWILFLSDDDELLPSAVEDMLTVARESGAEVVFTPTAFADDITEPVGRPQRLDGGFSVESCFSKIFMMRSYLQLFRWNSASHRKHWNRPADYDLYMRMQHAGVRFAIASQPGNIIHAVPGSEGRQGSAAEVWLAGREEGVKSPDSGRLN